MSVSVAVLFAGAVSIAPAAAVTVAVLTRSPVASGLTVPSIVSVRWLPPPGGRLALVRLTLLPATLVVPHRASPAATQCAVTPVIAAGTVSVTRTSVAVEGPALVTTSV